MAPRVKPGPWVRIRSSIVFALVVALVIGGTYYKNTRVRKLVSVNDTVGGWDSKDRGHRRCVVRGAASSMAARAQRSGQAVRTRLREGTRAAAPQVHGPHAVQRHGRRILQAAGGHPGGRRRLCHRWAFDPLAGLCMRAGSTPRVWSSGGDALPTHARVCCTPCALCAIRVGSSAQHRTC